MEDLVDAGLAKSIGISNFNKSQVDRILKICRIPPAVNQVEVNLHWLNSKLLTYCHSKNIQIEGYSSFGSPGYVQKIGYAPDHFLVHFKLLIGLNGTFIVLRGRTPPLLEEPNVIEIAKKYHKTPAQVLLRHGIQRGVVVLFKSASEERVKSNFEVKALI